MQPVSAEDSGRFAFVLMPFEPEFNHIYAQLIKPALEDEGFEVRRADSTFDQQNILRTIVQSIDAADLIVAELTTSNPNVFYELGIAHGLRKPVVLLSQELDAVPFDLRSYNIVTYSTRFDEVHKLKDRLAGIAAGLKKNSVGFGSPVTDFAPSAVGAHLATRPTTPTRTADGSPQEEPEGDLGTFDYAEDVENAIEEIGDTTVRLGGILEQFNERVTELAAEAQAADDRSAPGQSARMRKLGKAMASEIDALGQGIRDELPGLQDAWSRIEGSFTKLLSDTSIESDEDREQAIEVLNSLQTFRVAMEPALDGLREAREELAVNTGLSRDLNVAIRGTVGAIDDLIEELSTGDSSLTRMTNLLDQKIPALGLAEPEVGAVIGNSVRVSGSANTPEGTLSVRVKDASGGVMAEGTAQGGSSLYEYAPFELVLPLDERPKTGDGVVEAYTISGADSSERDLVSVPVKFGDLAQ